jgi:regulator of PEP synthase PpsR (kinase-PPPase family)
MTALTWAQPSVQSLILGFRSGQAKRTEFLLNLLDRMTVKQPPCVPRSIRRPSRRSIIEQHKIASVPVDHKILISSLQVALRTKIQEKQSNTMTTKKNLRFQDTIEILEFAIQLGDNPAGRDGPPITMAATHDLL